MTQRLAAQAELRLAKRMAGLGTEAAFEVLARARALEAQGSDVVHLEIDPPVSSLNGLNKQLLAHDGVCRPFAPKSKQRHSL